MASKVVPAAPRPKFATSWVDQMKEHHAADQLPPPTEKIEGDTKIVTEFRFNEEGKKVKTVKTYQIIKNPITTGTLQRRNWKPFGGNIQLQNEGAEETYGDDEVMMQFINQKDGEGEGMFEDDPWAKAKAANKQLFKCRVCAGNHATTQCPISDKIDPALRDEHLAAETAAKFGKLATNTEGKYIPPAQLRAERVGGRTDPLGMRMRTQEDLCTVRVTNLPSETQDSDIKELFGVCGRLVRVFLARDKFTGASRGYAFISFDKPEQAEHAVELFNGYGYANLILKVELARPT